MPKITPFLWFDTQTEAAIQRYASSFSDSALLSIRRYPDGPLDGPMRGMEGKVLTAVFDLAGQRFMALDGGPTFKFNPAISLFVSAATEAEVDRLWSTLSEGGSILMPLQSYPFSPRFGWVMDQYGLSWQVNLASRAQKIAPALMFVGEQHGKAEAAMNFYTALFAHSQVEHVERYGSGDTGEPGTVKQAIFQLDGRDFMVMDSSYEHAFSFNEAISFYVECGSQEEVDHFWGELSAHPQSEQCGWLKDRFGISWQIVPSIVPELMNDPDPVKSKRVMDALLQMKKLDIAGLERAYAG